jgi:hypothetical protein
VTRARFAVALGAAGILLGWLLSRGGLDEWSGARARAVVAFAALGWTLHLRARRRAGRPLRRALAQGVVGAVALCAAAAWFDFGAMPETGGVHRHDVFHYYLGGKYHRELGYGLIYRCAAVAEAEDGREAAVRQRMFRDLATLQILPAAEALADPSVCLSRFTEARWRSFRDDVHNLRQGVPEAAWNETQTDHGYNPTPAWTATSGALARLVPSTEAGLRLLSSLDLLLLAASIAALHAAFGWRVAALALTLWGTQEPGKFTWIAFAMLRLDWFFLLVASLALLRRGRPALAGAALGWAAAMRGFPALGLAGVLLAGAASPALRARLAPDRRRYVAGFVGALAVMIALGGAVAGPSSWGEWVGHIRRHAAASSSNNVGLGVIVAFDPAHRVEHVQERFPGAPTEQWTQRWADETRATREARKLPLRVLQLAFAALLVVALARQRRLWIGLVLAMLAAPIAVELSGYYLMLFVVAAALVTARASLERGLLGFAGAVQVLMVMPAVAWFHDDRHLALSIAYVGAATALTFTLARRRRAAGAPFG